MSLQWYFIWNKSKGPVLATDMLTNTIFNIWAVNIKTNGNIYEIKSMYICLGASQLVTQSPRHLVDLSRSWLVTQLTRHKEAVNSSQANISRTAAAVITLTHPVVRDRRHYSKNAQEIEQKTKWRTKHTQCSAHCTCREQNNVWSCESVTAAQTNFSVVHATNVALAR